MRIGVLTRIKRLEQVRAVSESDFSLKFEFAYLKLLPREYSGPKHIVTIGQRPDGREECEERPGPGPSRHEEREDPNVRKIYFVYASESSEANDSPAPGDHQDESD